MPETLELPETLVLAIFLAYIHNQSCTDERPKWPKLRVIYNSRFLPSLLHCTLEKQKAVRKLNQPDIEVRDAPSL